MVLSNVIANSKGNIEKCADSFSLPAKVFA